MKRMILAALTVLTLATCSGPTINRQNDISLWLPGNPHLVTPAGPYNNTANTLGGRNVGGGER